MEMNEAEHLDQGRVQSYGEGWVMVQGQRHTRSLLLHPAGCEPWSVTSIDQLQADDLAALLRFKPQLILLGTGSRLVWPTPKTLAACYQAGVAVEVMNTLAAARTYNFLLAEGRDVLAALMMAPQDIKDEA
jgi:uncharacterized protein